MEVFFVVYGLFIVFIIASLWVVFTKAGEPGWAALVPIYNGIVMLRIAGKEWWWIFLLMIPFVNIIVSAIVCIELAKSFGKETGFGIGLWLLGFIFFPILAFGSAEYLGPGGGGRRRSKRSMSRFDDDEDDDRPRGRGRSRDDDDDDDDRPRGRGKLRDDDDDRPRRRS